MCVRRQQQPANTVLRANDQLIVACTGARRSIAYNSALGFSVAAKLQQSADKRRLAESAGSVLGITVNLLHRSPTLAMPCKILSPWWMMQQSSVELLA